MFAPCWEPSAPQHVVYLLLKCSSFSPRADPQKNNNGVFLLARLLRLLEEIMSEKENKTIIFVETKRRCDELTRRMRRDGYENATSASHSSAYRMLLQFA